MEKKFLPKRDEAARPKAAAPETKREAAQKQPDPAQHQADRTGLAGLQDQMGNQAVQRLIAEEGSQGQPLDQAAQAKMEETTGQSLDGVQIHTGAQADALSRKLGAKAFAAGNDIYFQSGAYQPDTPAGQKLLAHELTHVVQQRQAANSGASPAVNTPGDAHEREADAVAGAVLEPGSQVQIQGQALAGIQRQELDEEEMPLTEEIEMPAESVDIVEEEEEAVE